MEAQEFIEAYPDMVWQIGQVIRPELQVVIDDMAAIDPHDLVSPGTHFIGRNHAAGYVWRMFVTRCIGRRLLSYDDNPHDRP